MLLNQSYEPLTVCNVRKAIILIVLEKAEIVANNNSKQIRSVSISFPWPSVIRLVNFINVPYKRIILSRKNILKRDSFQCAYCGTKDMPLTIDHIIPKARGGGDVWDNMITACIRCNNKKGDRTPEEAGMHLRKKPYIPNHFMLIQNMHEQTLEVWKPYLFNV